MKASELLRDLLTPGIPATPATSATTRASTTFQAVRQAATFCDRAGELSQMSQAVANAESEQPCGLSQKSQVSQGGMLAAPATPCPTCGCGSYWHAADGWHCEGCTPPAGAVERWLHVSGGKLAPMPPPELPWPPELNDMARRVADHFEWTADDRRDFVAWARRSPEALADAAEFLRTECAKLPGQRLQFNSTEGRK